MRLSPKLHISAVLLLLGLALPAPSCATARVVDDAEGLSRARVQLGRGLRFVQVDQALLDTSGPPLRAQVDLSNRSNVSKQVRGYFQWKDEAGINLGGRADQVKSVRQGEVVSFTSFAPSPEAYQYVFIARNE